jgi:glutathione S-transferase
LAKKFNIAGSNDIETAYVDMYTGQLLDLFDQIARYSMETNITVKERLFNETWSRNLAFFESRLNLTNTGFLIGSKITWADLYLSSVLDNLGNRTNSVLEKFNRVKRLDQRVKAIPNVNRWLKQRPVTEF